MKNDIKITLNYNNYAPGMCKIVISFPSLAWQQ